MRSSFTREEQAGNMPSEISVPRRTWRRFLSNHNPLYLLSAWLVLHGLGTAFKVEAGPRWVPLMTQLLCCYILALVFSGWLVIRIGKLWEDARMILLVVLLMFTALSTSYDDLCLKDPVAGAEHLAVGFLFCCGTTELVLRLLGIRLCARYRIPFYLQLAVLFAFPVWLGRFSILGNDPAMCLGVLAFPVAAGVALLTLLPAAMRSALQEGDNGTPWPWPYFPWSIFVFVAIAFVIRTWMLSLSFTPAMGVQPAFLPYFVSPILLGMLILALEIGLRRRSSLTQFLALLAMLAVVLMSFPGELPNLAQLRTLNLLEQSLAGPPLIVCAAVAIVALVSMVRGAWGSEFVAVTSLTLLACLGPGVRSLPGAHAPNEVLMLAIVAWQLVRGVEKGSTVRMLYVGLALIFGARHNLRPDWMFAHHSFWTFQIVFGWCLLLPLYCRDGLARWTRAAAPALFTAAAAWTACFGAGVWGFTPNWLAAGSVTLLTAMSLLYWAVFRDRWLLAATGWAGAVASALWLFCGFEELTDVQLRRGLAWYVLGCFTLFTGLAVSLVKAKGVARLWNWLQQGNPSRVGTDFPGG